jgi:hypothetical protein
MNILKKVAVFYFSATFLFSCSNLDLSHSGKLIFHNSAQKTSFSFVVSEEFNKQNSTSKPSKDYPKMTEAEAKLLLKFLKKNNYCINKNGEITFVIISRQEKVFDVTFSSLIGQNYNARPVTPTTYFGECF